MILFNRNVVVLFIMAGLVMHCRAEGNIMQNIEFPMERYEDGRIKTLLKAGQASFTAEDIIDASDVTLLFFGERGETGMVVRAENCVFNRTRGRAGSKGRITVESGDTLISGTGFDWYMKDGKVAIRSAARIEFNRGTGISLGGGGAWGGGE